MTGPTKLVTTLLLLATVACGDLTTSPGSVTVLQQAPPSAMITGTVYLDGVGVPAWTIELIGWLDSGLTASTPLGSRTTDADGRYAFSLHPEAHHCGRMSARATPVLIAGTPPTPLSPDTGTHFPIPCGTTDSLDFHFETAP